MIARLLRAAAACLLLAGCSPGEGDVNLTWEVEPEPPVVGTSATGYITLRDATLAPITGARIQVEGHMAHPGMEPVLATAVEGAAGVYQVPLAFTMAGDWIILVKGTLPDGTSLSRRIDVAGVRPAG